MRLCLICLFLILAACQAAQPAVQEATAVPPTKTAVPSHTPSATNTAVPTQTLPPAATQTAPATLTAVPTQTPAATATSSPTPLVARTCPDPPPPKPTYLSNYLGPEVWPTAAVGQSPHFWLSDPVAEGRKPLENGYYPYGWDGGDRFLLHNGADFPRALGTAVTAVANGTIIVAQSDEAEWFGWRCDWYGQLLVLELAERWQAQPVYVLYGHVQNLQVAAGDVVGQGDVLAEVGVEGVSTVPHLHLEVRIGNNSFGSTVNPMLWLEPLPQTGVLAGRLVDPEGRPWQGVRVTLVKASGEDVQYRHSFTYLDDRQHLIHPDVELAENFVFADLPTGNYTLFVTLQGEEVRQSVEIEAGMVTAVEIITAPLQPTEE